MATEKPKERKRPERKPRDFVILEPAPSTDDPAGSGAGGVFNVVGNGFKDSTDAMKFVRKNADKLAGKILCVAAIGRPFKVQVKTKTVATFGTA
jgi:hypothetical protein